ncbi:hypothetical protein V1478_012413 [Vespula squamosa]|uniref:Uncharacterized protein n=1 Tax=Vespula squamosa TaxID=30214 RepID=A0ABD2ADY5_VESSQ
MFFSRFHLIPILIDSLARTCHKNTIKSAKSGPERMLSHRCTQATPPMGLMLGIPWGIERLKYSPEEDTGSDDPRRSYCYVTPTVMNPPYTSVSYSESWPPTEYISKPATGSCKRCTVRITLCALRKENSGGPGTTPSYQPTMFDQASDVRRHDFYGANFLTHVEQFTKAYRSKQLFATKVKTLGLKVNEEAAFERMASRSCFRKNERALDIFLGISPDKSRNTLPDYDVP